MVSSVLLCCVVATLAVSSVSADEGGTRGGGKPHEEVVLSALEKIRSAALNGNYYCVPHEQNGLNLFAGITTNDWHAGTIKGGTWANKAGKNWTLTPTANDDVLASGPTCPYHVEGSTEDLNFYIQRGLDNTQDVVGFKFKTDHFMKLDDEHFEYDGHYHCQPKMSTVSSTYHFGFIMHGVWLNAHAGSWGLRKIAGEDKLRCLDDCPFADTAKHPWVEKAGGAVFSFSRNAANEIESFGFVGETCARITKSSYQKLVREAAANQRRGEL